jgi:hypothetical protein
VARARWALGPGSRVGQSRAGAHSATGQRVWEGGGPGGFHTLGQIRSLQIVPECEVVVSDPSAHFLLTRTCGFSSSARLMVVGSGQCSRSWGWLCCTCDPGSTKLFLNQPHCDGCASHPALQPAPSRLLPGPASSGQVLRIAFA